MANETLITVTGNLTADPELRFTQGGAAVANFTVASTPRSFDKQSGQWKDGETLFLRCSAWREYAENIAESLKKGMGVIVQGSLVQRSYKDKQGNDRSSFEIQVVEVGPTLRYAKAQVVKTQRGQNGAQQFAGGANSPAAGYSPTQPVGGPQNGSYAPDPFGGPSDAAPF